MSSTKSAASPMWKVAGILALVFVGSTLPTSLYAPYQKALRFSEITLTLIYAAYVAGTLFALLFLGRLSDQIGRRRVALPALLVGAASTVVFVSHIGIPFLFAGRFLSGLSVGLVAGACTAWIAELHPGKDTGEATAIAAAGNLLGLGIGPLLSGILAEYAPWPLRLSYFVYLAILVPVAFIARSVPETVEHPVRRMREVSLQPRLGVPRELRASFVSPALTGFAIFALGGFYAALTPGMLTRDLRQTSHAVAGAVIFEFFVAGAAAIAIARRLGSRTSILAGLVLLLPALFLLVLAGRIASMPLFLCATGAGGVALALGYCGSLELINEIAPKDRRAEILSTYFVVCYAGVSAPVIGVGVLSHLLRPDPAIIAFAVSIALLAVVALATGLEERKNATRRKRTPPPSTLRRSTVG